MKKSWGLIGAALIALTAAFFVSCSQDEGDDGVGTNYAGTYTATATVDGETTMGLQLKVEGTGGTDDSTWGLYNMSDSGYETDPTNSGTWEANGDSTIKATLTISEGDSSGIQAGTYTFNFLLYSKEQEISATEEGMTATVRYTFDYSDAPEALQNAGFTPWSSRF